MLTAIMKTSVRRKLEPQHPEPQKPTSPSLPPLESIEDIALGALATGRTSCACAAQITEHGFAKAGRLRQGPANRKKCRLSQVEEGQPGIVPRLPNSGSGRAARRELDLPGPPDTGGCNRGRANFGQGTLEGFLIGSARFHVPREAIPICFSHPPSCERGPLNVFTITNPSIIRKSKLPARLLARPISAMFHRLADARGETAKGRPPARAWVLILDG
jgi:hypothetical protein